MDERRYYLKDLASRQARLWGTAPLPPCYAGETRIETRNTVYEMLDGICQSAVRRDRAPVSRSDPYAFVGMRVVGWLTREDPQGGLTLDWRPGAYAVLWRPRAEGEEHSAVALTSSTIGFKKAQRTAPPPILRPTPLPPLPIPPVVVSRPPPPSMTRLHPQSEGADIAPSAVLPRGYASQVQSVVANARAALAPMAPRQPLRAAMPAAPDTPTPRSSQVRSSSVPPPLPPRAKVTGAGAKVPLARVRVG
jgi:hypothetical protein